MNKKISKIPPIKSSSRIKTWVPASTKTKASNTVAKEKVLEKDPCLKQANIKNSAFTQKMTHLKEDLKEINSKYQFLMAEFANYKKQSFKQIEILRKYEGQNFILELLNTVMDDFDRAIDSKISEEKKSYKDFRRGIDLIYQKLKSLLLRFEVKEQPAIGKSFDPKKHTALSSVSNKEVPPDHIVLVIKKAYTFKDKLIREASVVVSKKPDEVKKNG